MHVAEINIFFPAKCPWIEQHALALLFLWSMSMFEGPFVDNKLCTRAQLKKWPPSRMACSSVPWWEKKRCWKRRWPGILLHLAWLKLWDSEVWLMQKRILAHTSQVLKWKRKGRDIYIYIIWKTTAWMLGGAARLNMTQALSCLKLETLKFRTYGRGLLDLILFCQEVVVTSAVTCYPEQSSLLFHRPNIWNWCRPRKMCFGRCVVLNKDAQHSILIVIWKRLKITWVCFKIRDPSYSCLRILNYLYWRCRGVPFWQVGRSYSEGVCISLIWSTLLYLE